MKGTVLIFAIALIVSPALAGPDVLPITGAGHLNYDLATGQMTLVDGPTRQGDVIWSCGIEYVNDFWAASAGEMGLDWGDIAAPTCVGGFGFSQFTNSQDADGDLYAVIMIYAEENGWNSSGREYIAGFMIENIPGSTFSGNQYWGYYWSVDLYGAFVLEGSDLDGDDLTDWGYAQQFSVRTPGAVHGPAICGLVNPDELPDLAPGIEDAYDLFLRDPNDGEFYYDGTYSFGGPPLFAQFHFELYGPYEPNEPNLSPECEWLILGCDRTLNLADLATLLSNYGCTTGCTRWDGDVDPIFEGDGDVDLADLALILSAYHQCP